MGEDMNVADTAFSENHLGRKYVMEALLELL